MAASRGDYVPYLRPRGSYASDVTDREWALIAPMLPRDFPPRSTVYGHFRAWTWATQ
jgi:transposase